MTRSLICWGWGVAWQSVAHWTPFAWNTTIRPVTARNLEIYLASNYMGSTDGKTADISAWPFWPGSWERFAQQTRSDSTKRLGVLRSRPGGFVSLQPLSDNASQGGSLTSWLTTRPLITTPGTILSINADCSAPKSRIEVEVWTVTAAHPSGLLPLPGFSGGAAAVFSGDKTRARLQWAGGEAAVGWGQSTAFALRVTLVGGAKLFGLTFDKNASFVRAQFDQL